MNLRSTESSPQIVTLDGKIKEMCRVGGDGGGGAEVDQQSLRHVDVEAERVGACQHEERDGQQQYQGKFTWRQNILLVALEWVQLISFSGHLE